MRSFFNLHGISWTIIGGTFHDIRHLIRPAMNDLQNLKAMGPDLEIMRAERPGKYVITSFFGKDNITVFGGAVEREFEGKQNQLMVVSVGMSYDLVDALVYGFNFTGEHYMCEFEDPTLVGGYDELCRSGNNMFMLNSLGNRVTGMDPKDLVRGENLTEAANGEGFDRIRYFSDSWDVLEIYEILAGPEQTPTGCFSLGRHDGHQGFTLDGDIIFEEFPITRLSEGGAPETYDEVVHIVMSTCDEYDPPVGGSGNTCIKMTNVALVGPQHDADGKDILTGCYRQYEFWYSSAAYKNFWMIFFFTKPADESIGDNKVDSGSFKCRIDTGFEIIIAANDYNYDTWQNVEIKQAKIYDTSAGIIYTFSARINHVDGPDEWNEWEYHIIMRGEGGNCFHNFKRWTETDDPIEGAFGHKIEVEGEVDKYAVGVFRISQAEMIYNCDLGTFEKPIP